MKEVAKSKLKGFPIKNRTKRQDHVVLIVFCVIFAIYAFVLLFPFYWILLNSFKDRAQFSQDTWSFPTTWVFSNYSQLFQLQRYKFDVFDMFKNSLILCLIVPTMSAISTTLAAYVMAKYKFKGRNIVFLTVILALLIPPQTMIIATYGIWSKLGMINTFMPVLLPTLFGLGIRGGLFALIYMYFFQRIPDAMDDAARIDGAGPFRVFLQIMLPLVRSAIAIVFIFSFVWHWNDNYEAPRYMYKDKMMTLQPKLQNIRQYFADLMGDSGAGDSAITKAMTEPTLFAGCLLVLLPVLIVFIIGQKKLAAGIERIGVIE